MEWEGQLDLHMSGECQLFSRDMQSYNELILSQLRESKIVWPT